MQNFKVIIVEDVPLELKGTEGIIHKEIPEAEIIGTADTEYAYWHLIKKQLPDLVLLDLGLGGSTTVGVEICRQTKEAYPQVKILIFTGEILNEKLWVDVLDLGLGGSTTVGVEICRQTKELYPQVKVLIFTGEILNEKLWVDVLDAGADGIILKTGELLTRNDVSAVMEGKQLVFNEPILRKIVDRFKNSVGAQIAKQDALINYEIDEYDERFLRHLALGYTKDQITQLRAMPFGVKSLEKRQNELIQKLFPDSKSVNATRLVVRAIELHILDIDNLEPDDE